MSDPFSHKVFDKILIPDTLDGQNSRAFSVPKGAKVMTIHAPDLPVATTYAIQAADPRDSDFETLVWRTLVVVVITATIGFMTVTGIPDNQAVTIPVAALGGSVLRFVASVGVTGGIDSQTIKVTWGMDG